MGKSTSVRAIIIHPDATVEVQPRYECSLRNLTGTVGGYLEAIGFNGWHAYVNEDGIAMRLQQNPLAASVASLLGWRSFEATLRGTAIFLGDGPDGEEADVPEYVATALNDLGYPIDWENA